jgi:hypothetical protein
MPFPKLLSGDDIFVLYFISIDAISASEGSYVSSECFQTNYHGFEC